MVIYEDPKMKELSPEQVGRMQQYLRDAMIKELRDAGYEVGTKSQAETMRLTFTISGLKAPSAIPNVTAALAPIAVSVGDVTVEWVLREALTHRIDAVAVTRARGARMLNLSPWSTWADVEKTFDVWAKGLREAVDKAHAE
jgi:plastocyanin